VSRVASQSGNASAMFIDSWVVGVNVYGSRPNKLIVSKSIIRDVRIRDHLWPFLLSGIISCLVIRWRIHDWMVRRRLVIHRLSGEGSRRAGNSIESRIRGIPRKCGLANWSKKLRFMVKFKGWIGCL